ncbi:hypothetical protein EV702DRAFT_1046353 [Suillus placidus]|uniref:Uncharacterized protein n=1 Tax=Suillus placidus TaxID=48579 RepID=A0A9P6ZTX8_9AGAM|nr:hypothetical protein EV702DRAFT_1046353 [Suillus placidus]
MKTRKVVDRVLKDWQEVFKSTEEGKQVDRRMEIATPLALSIFTFSSPIVENYLVKQVQNSGKFADKKMQYNWLLQIQQYAVDLKRAGTRILTRFFRMQGSNVIMISRVWTFIVRHMITIFFDVGLKAIKVADMPMEDTKMHFYHGAINDIICMGRFNEMAIMASLEFHCPFTNLQSSDAGVIIHSKFMISWMCEVELCHGHIITFAPKNTNEAEQGPCWQRRPLVPKMGHVLDVVEKFPQYDASVLQLSYKHNFIMHPTLQQIEAI